MDPLVAVKIIEALHNSESAVYLSHIIMDGNTTTMEQLQHASDGSMLSNYIPAPKKRGDVGHMVGGLGSQLEEVSDMTMAKLQINKQIIAKIKYNFSFWIHWYKKNKSSVDKAWCTHYTCVYHIFGNLHLYTPECPA
eukprot:15364645-Ditylum_brightwellii.AAC.1